MPQPDDLAVLPTVLVLLLVAAVVWAVRLVRLSRSVGRYADYWSHPRGVEGGLLYVALGDSAAQGIGASCPENGYVGLLADRLRQRTGRPVQVVNLSLSGARVRAVLDVQLPALAALGREPDVVTLAIGGNDVRRYGAAAFAGQCARLARLLPVGTYVADVPYFMHGRWERDAEEAARALADAASKSGLRVVRLHEALRGEGWAAMLTQYAADCFHPNDRGYRVWARAFWSEMAVDAPAT